MKLQLIMVCLLMSGNLYTMDENNKDHLQKALVHAQQKKDNEIVIFYYANTQELNNFGSQDQDIKKPATLISSNQNLEQKLQAYCEENKTVVLLDNLNKETSSVNGKTTIYMIRQLNLPVNHNDSDLFHIHNAIEKLKEEQGQIPFIIATTEKGRENLKNYLKRQYPNDVLVSFPENDGNFFTKPLVIVVGVVALLGLWYFCFRAGVYYESSKYKNG